MARTPRRFGADPRNEGTTGGPRTTPMSPERKEVLRKAEEENARNRRGAPPVEKKAKGGELKKGGKTMHKMKMAKGGSTASKRADGIAKKGKTKGMMPKMAKGGKTKGC
jgi:hypothetical protein